MATRTQAKAAVDAAAVDIKADIDNILPSGVNIKDGNVAFNPTKYYIVLDAGGSLATATSWMTSIQTNLTTANRTFITLRADRRSEDAPSKSIRIVETKLTVLITNF